MNRLVLGTTSKYKIALFKRLGLPFQTASPPLEEKLVLGQDPRDQALRLAGEKADSLREAYADHVIIGADQILALGQTIFTKPGSQEKAVTQIMQLSGRTHALHTAYAILDTQTGRKKSRLVTSRLRVRGDLKEAWVRELVRRDQTQDCVGGYKWESLGIQLFTAVRTPDPNAIVGLPLLALAGDLRSFL